MGELEEFLDPDAGGAEHLDDRPGPEGVVFLPGQVVAFAAWVVGPDPMPGLRAAVRVKDCPPAVNVPPGGVRLAAAACSAVWAWCSAAERTSTGRTGRRSRVRASMRDLRRRSSLRVLTSVLADRAGRGPRPPAGRVLGRPAGQVQVEGADREQGVPAGEPWLPAVRLPAGGKQSVLVRSRCFQAAATPRRQVQAADAGMVVLEVGPEVPAELLGQRVQAAVVQGGLAFLEVVDEQVADRAAGELVAVDQLGRAALPDGHQLGQRGWRVRAEGAALRAAAATRWRCSHRADGGLSARRRAVPGSRPAVTSVSVPPLAAMRTAARPMVACRAPAVDLASRRRRRPAAGRTRPGRGRVRACGPAPTG